MTGCLLCKAPDAEDGFCDFCSPEMVEAFEAGRLAAVRADVVWQVPRLFTEAMQKRREADMWPGMWTDPARLRLEQEGLELLRQWGDCRRWLKATS